jgi:hypothetical protein
VGKNVRPYSKKKPTKKKKKKKNQKAGGVAQVVELLVPGHEFKLQYQ